jgi:hypothetical protein
MNIKLAVLLLWDMYEQFSFLKRVARRQVVLLLFPLLLLYQKSGWALLPWVPCCLLGSERGGKGGRWPALCSKENPRNICMHGPDANGEARSAISSKGIDENKAVWSSVYAGA